MHLNPIILHQVLGKINFNFGRNLRSKDHLVSHTVIGPCARDISQSHHVFNKIHRE